MALAYKFLVTAVIKLKKRRWRWGKKKNCIMQRIFTVNRINQSKSAAYLYFYM